MSMLMSVIVQEGTSMRSKFNIYWLEGPSNLVTENERPMGRNRGDDKIQLRKLKQPGRNVPRDLMSITSIPS